MIKFTFNKSLQHANRWMYYTVGAVFALVIGTYFIWRLARIISPETNYSTSAVHLILRSTEHSKNNDGSFSPLPNSLTDQAKPDYSQASLTPTILPINGNSVPLFRIQGEVEYQ